MLPPDVRGRSERMLGVCTYVYVHMYMYIYIFFAFRSLRYRTLHNTVHTVLCQTIAFRKTKILHNTVCMYSDGMYV